MEEFIIEGPPGFKDSGGSVFPAILFSTNRQSLMGSFFLVPSPLSLVPCP